MRTRRAFLATGLGLLICSAGQRAQAVGVEAEGAAYGGRTSGGWICGPMGTAHYGGVGTQVTVSQHERSEDQGRGFMGDAAVAGEATSVTITSCDSSTCAPAGATPDRLMLGGRLRTGWEGRYFGFELGGGVYQGWGAATDTRPALSVYPDLALSFGWLHHVYGLLGVGTPLVTELLHPGAYAGIGAATKENLGVELYGGVFRQGPASFDSVGPRFDLVGRAPIPFTQNLYLRLGGSVGLPSNAPLDWEGSLGLAAGY